MGFLAIFNCVNVALCVVYAVTGKIPGFENGLLPDNLIGTFVPLGIVVYVVLSATRQYLSGSVAKTRFALGFMIESKRLALLIVLLPPVFLFLHVFFKIMNIWWGNFVFSALTLLAAKIYYREFAMFKEVSPAEVGAFMGISLPDVRAKKQKVRTIHIFGINFGTLGTFFATQWALATFARGILQIVI